MRWLYPLLPADKHKTYCLYEAPSGDAIRRASGAGIPADEITEATGRVLCRAFANRARGPVWTLRGRGGNSGSCEFTFDLHEIGPDVTAGLIVWSADPALAAGLPCVRYLQAGVLVVWPVGGAGTRARHVRPRPYAGLARRNRPVADAGHSCR